jgi:hypothetical protein
MPTYIVYQVRLHSHRQGWGTHYTETKRRDVELLNTATWFLHNRHIRERSTCQNDVHAENNNIQLDSQKVILHKSIINRGPRINTNLYMTKYYTISRRKTDATYGTKQNRPFFR